MISKHITLKISVNGKVSYFMDPRISYFEVYDYHVISDDLTYRYEIYPKIAQN